LREEAIYRGREKAIHQGREEAVHRGREDGHPLRGGCHSSGGGRSSGRGRSLGGGHSAREEAIRREGEETIRQGREFVERCGCSSMWWEGRTMNFRVGKFKIQHNRMMLEFERT